MISEAIPYDMLVERARSITRYYFDKTKALKCAKLVLSSCTKFEVLPKYAKQNYASIPCTPDGKVLRKCTEVVDRDADFAPCMISLIAIFLVTNYQKGIFLG